MHRQIVFQLPDCSPIHLEFTNQEQVDNPENEWMKHPNKYHSFNISQGKWRQFHLKHTLTTVKQWPIRGSLFLHSNKQPHIIRSLSFTKFTHLRLLSLKDNNIVSIEGLCRIQAPCLGQLSVQNNLIVNIGSIRKVYLPNLVRLSLENNFIVNGCSITELGSPQISEISLSRRHEESYLWILKLQNPFLQSFQIMDAYIDNNLKDRQVIENRENEFQFRLYRGNLFGRQPRLNGVNRGNRYGEQPNFYDRPNLQDRNPLNRQTLLRKGQKLKNKKIRMMRQKFPQVHSSLIDR